MPAVGNRNPFTVQYLDYSGEVESLRLFSGDLTALTLAAFLAQFGDLQTALDAVTLGTRSKQTWGQESIVSNTKPTGKDAQIETQLLVRYMGETTQKPYSFRIPTAYYTAFNYVGDHVVLSGAGATTATTNLVSALEAIGATPDDPTEGIIVTDIEVVR